MAASISGYLVAGCEELASVVHNEDAGRLIDQIKDSVLEPVRIAVAGRVSSGKSTMVNALLGRRVAPTNVSECTKVVTRFRYGHPERVDMVMVGGSIRTKSLRPDGLLPELGVAVDTVDHLEVHLSDAVLKGMTLVDTPGLASANERGAAAGELMAIDGRSRAALAQADAVVFMLAETVRQDDVAALQGFRDLFSGLRVSAVNAVGVVSKADKLDDDSDDPWATAGAVAQRQARILSPLLAEVIPIIGLLAETAASQEFNEEDAHDLRALARADSRTRARMLLSVEGFRRAEVEVPPARRGRLLELLDLHGIGLALASIDEGDSSAAALVERLRRASHIDELRALIQRVFRRQADAIKADWAVSALSRLAYEPSLDAAVQEILRRKVEQLRLLPEMHRVAEMAVLHDLAAGTISLPERLRGDLDRLARAESIPERLGIDPSASAGQLREAALQRASAWRAFVNDPRVSRAEARAGAVVCRSFELMLSAVSSP